MWRGDSNCGPQSQPVATTADIAFFQCLNFGRHGTYQMFVLFFLSLLTIDRVLLHLTQPSLQLPAQRWVVDDFILFNVVQFDVHTSGSKEHRAQRFTDVRYSRTNSGNQCCVRVSSQHVCRKFCQFGITVWYMSKPLLWICQCCDNIAECGERYVDRFGLLQATPFARSTSHTL